MSPKKSLAKSCSKFQAVFKPPIPSLNSSAYRQHLLMLAEMLISLLKGPKAKPRMKDGPTFQTGLRFNSPIWNHFVFGSAVHTSNLVKSKGTFKVRTRAFSELLLPPPLPLHFVARLHFLWGHTEVFAKSPAKSPLSIQTLFCATCSVFIFFPLSLTALLDKESN